MEIGAIFIVDSSEFFDADGLNRASFIAYENYLSHAEGYSSYPSTPKDISYLHDNMTNMFIEFSAGTSSIEFLFSENKLINCLALAGLNWLSSACTLSFFIWDLESSAYIKLFDATGTKDGKPLLKMFSELISNRFKIQITCTSTAYLAEACLTKALMIPVLPDASGFKPALWSNEHIVTNTVTQATNLGPSTVIKKGWRESITFSQIPYQFMNNEWSSFVDYATGRIIWFAWDAIQNSNNVIYGHWEQQEPSYVSSMFSRISLEIKGLA